MNNKPEMGAGAQVAVDAKLLRSWPLPHALTQGDKESRGAVLVIAGSPEVPGALLLAGTAALRAGAGKLMMATAASVAPGVALAMPEARVVGLPESAGGGLLASGAEKIAGLADDVNAVLIGPGLADEDATLAFILALLPRLAHVPVVLDALAVNAVSVLGRFSQPVLLTPHAGEMAHACNKDKSTVVNKASALSQHYAQEWNAVLALKGAVTYIATPAGQAWQHEGYEAGLATSGSGDVLAGIAAGLLARGASLAQSAVWAVGIHARAGRRVSAGSGPIGYLAREICDAIPRVMAESGQ